MLNESKIARVAKPEHIEIAEKMAYEIIDRFPPIEQNEAVKQIYEIIKDRRVSAIKDAEERCQFLNDSLIQLG